MQLYQLPPKLTTIIHYDSIVGIRLSDILATIIVSVCTLCGNCDELSWPLYTDIKCTQVSPEVKCVTSVTIKS
jgi:hypothetical protein